VLPFLLTTVGLLAPSAQEAPAELPSPTLTERVNRAIARGVDLLKKRQAPDGRWAEAEDRHPGGMTALCALTLLKSGVRRGDDSVQRAMKVVLDTQFRSTYSHSVRLMLLDALAQPETWREPAKVSLDALVATQDAGLWAYPDGAVDLSNTQFALLGLRAAHRLGLEVPQDTLLATLKALPRWQERSSGGYKYDDGKPPTASISAATLGGFAVLEELSKGRGACESVLRKGEAERKRALTWFVERFDVAHNAWGRDAWTPSFQYPYLWAIERYGGLTGRSKVGEHDWYDEGAQWLVAAQERDGSWGKTEHTCFALLFLRRATISSGGGLIEVDGEIDAAAPKFRPPANTPHVTSALVAGPWTADEFGETLISPPFEPNKLRPREGDKVARKEWNRVELKPDGWTDIEPSLAGPSDRGVFLVATRLAWNGDEPFDATLWFDLEDGWDVYLDGARISNGRRVQGPIDMSLSVDVTLARGEHSLACIVEDALGAAAFGVCVLARDGSAPSSELEVGVEAAKARKR